MNKLKTIIGFVIVTVLCLNLMGVQVKADTRQGLIHNEIGERIVLQSYDEIMAEQRERVEAIYEEAARIKKEREEEEARRKAEEERLRYIEEHTINIVVTFYTELAEENGGYAGMTCEAKRLVPGMVATIDELPLGTILETETFGTLTVADRMHRGVGLSRCGNYEYPIDMFVARNYGESDYEYKRRVNKMGVVRTTAVVYYN